MAEPQEQTTPTSRRFPLNVVFLLALGVSVAVAATGFALARQQDESTGADDGAAGKSPAKADGDADSGDSEPSDGETAEGETVEDPFPGAKQKVPDGILDGGTGWLNTSGPISMRDLRGKIVVFDFWTYCCINCMHVLPDLEYLEEKYEDELVVIGVHSAKFDNEKNTAAIRKAIQRYEIEHPVINDSRMIVWRKFGASSWPTLAVVDAEGRFIGATSGEGRRDLLDQVIGKLVEYHEARGTLDKTPVRFDLETEKLKPTPLRFPGKVLADEASNRLFVSDTNHNRIVISDLEGNLLETIGTGAIGRKDGGYDEAQFDHPQGLSLVGSTLYVADTENHLLRKVDLEEKTVSTLAGTGRQARFRAGGGTLAETALNSPWALQHVDGTLYVAMAGPHQLWKHELGSDRIEVFAGSGAEDVKNGSLESSAFAQPSGLATDGEFLYVCDSEGSAIRKVPLDPKGEVTTIVGTFDLFRGRSLFEFGDIDGVGDEARLQHPLGIAIDGDVLYVADSYNHKLKKLTPVVEDGKPTGAYRSTTWAGDGKSGDRLDPVRFAEPHGLALTGGRLIVADTNNHRLVSVDLKTKAATPFEIDGLKPPEPPEPEPVTDDFAPDKPFTGVTPQVVRSGEQLDFEIKLNLPEGYELNDRFPVTWKAKSQQDESLVAEKSLEKRARAELKDGVARLSLPLAARAGKDTLMLAVSYGYCRKGRGGLCKYRTERFHVPVELAAEEGSERISLETPQPKSFGAPEEGESVLEPSKGKDGE